MYTCFGQAVVGWFSSSLVGLSDIVWGLVEIVVTSFGSNYWNNFFWGGGGGGGRGVKIYIFFN